MGKMPDFHLLANKKGAPSSDQHGSVAAPSLFVATSYIQEKVDTDFIHSERMYFKFCPNILTFVPSEHII